MRKTPNTTTTISANTLKIASTALRPYKAASPARMPGTPRMEYTQIWCLRRPVPEKIDTQM
jgi:hypothetical protein